MLVSIMLYNLVLTVGFVDKMSSEILSHGAKYFCKTLILNFLDDRILHGQSILIFQGRI